MLVFATSDKGGTGRSVTSANLAYRHALQGHNACYVDFDFGSPTAGAIFHINAVSRGAKAGGLHSYLLGSVGEPVSMDVWRASDREGIRDRPRGAGELVLFPGDSGGGEFAGSAAMVERCVRLFVRLEEQFDLCLVDLSAGRSFATDIVLTATHHPQLRSAVVRWLVFHRWTRQHIIAANGLVFGAHGIIESGVERGHDREALRNAIRFVRTAYVDPDSASLSGLRSTQIAWLRETNEDLQELAGRSRLGSTTTLGSVPLDPILQWREQLILDDDAWTKQVANEATIESFDRLAKNLVDELIWEGL